MSYTFKALSQDEQDDIVVAYFTGLERDKFSHEINLNRFDAMLPNLPDGDFKKRISELRADTASRLVEVDALIAATEAQIPPADRLTASQQRISSKAAAQSK